MSARFASLLLLVLVSPAVAQEVSLNRVDSLSAVGRFGEARDLLQTWWSDESGTASRLEMQRALWLRAILTVDPSLAEADYQRLVVEYPGGSFTDRALLRLGYAAHAAGDLAGARENFEMLARDYPSSPLRPTAVSWLETYGEAAAGDSAARVAAPVPATAPSLPTRAGEESVLQRGGAYALQLGAFARLAGARAVAARAERAGLQARLVRTPGSDLIRVRVGRYLDPASASTDLETARGAGLEAIVVEDADQEIPVS